MRVAIIDLGTNTFNLLIADIFPDKTFKILYVEEYPAKLGQGGLNKKMITPEAFQRGLDGLKKHLATIASYEVENVKAFATSGVRSTDNGKEFIDAAFRETGLSVKVISGEDEAQLIYKGVHLSGLITDPASLIIDIGGGSTEFIIADKKQMLWKQSFDLGVTRLIQQFNPSDPVSEENIISIYNYFDECLQPLFVAEKQCPVSSLIGCSGSFESFVSIINGMQIADNNRVEKRDAVIEMSDFMALHELLLYSDTSQRKKLKGLVPFRVDNIVFAAIFVKFIIEKFKIPELFISHYSLKEGALFDMIFER